MTVVHGRAPHRRIAPSPRPAGERGAVRRVPRLLVLGSELSWRFLVCVAAAAVVVYLLDEGQLRRHPGHPRAAARDAARAAGAGAPAHGRAAGAGDGGRLPRRARRRSRVLVALLAPPVVNEFGTLGDRVRERRRQARRLPRRLAAQARRARGPARDRPHRRPPARQQRHDHQRRPLRRRRSLGQILAGLLLTLVCCSSSSRTARGCGAGCSRLFPETRRRPAVEEAGRESWHVLTPTSAASSSSRWSTRSASRSRCG